MDLQKNIRIMASTAKMERITVQETSKAAAVPAVVSWFWRSPTDPRHWSAMQTKIKSNFYFYLKTKDQLIMNTDLILWWSFIKILLEKHILFYFLLRRSRCWIHSKISLFFFFTYRNFLNEVIIISNIFFLFFSFVCLNTDSHANTRIEVHRKFVLVLKCFHFYCEELIIF